MTNNKFLALLLTLGVVGQALSMDNATSTKNLLPLMRWLSYVDVGPGIRGLETQLAACFCTFSKNLDCNRACCLSNSLGKPDLEEVRQYMANFPYGWWILSDQQTKAAKSLIDNGYQKNKQEHLMTLTWGDDLRNFKAKDDRITVKKCESEEDYMLWIYTSAAGFKLTPIDVRQFIQRIRNITNDENVSLYIASINDIAASTGMFIIHDDDPEANATTKTVCIHWLSTIQEHRRKHAATFLCLQALYDAGEAGCRRAIALSSPMAVRLFNNFGFKTVGMVDVYTPPPAQQIVEISTAQKPVPSHQTSNESENDPWFGSGW
jgi:hypothetical protein